VRFSSILSGRHERIKKGSNARGKRKECIIRSSIHPAARRQKKERKNALLLFSLLSAAGASRKKEKPIRKGKKGKDAGIGTFHPLSFPGHQQKGEEWVRGGEKRKRKEGPLVSSKAEREGIARSAPFSVSEKARRQSASSYHHKRARESERRRGKRLEARKYIFSRPGETGRAADLARICPAMRAKDERGKGDAPPTVGYPGRLQKLQRKERGGTFHSSRLIFFHKRGEKRKRKKKRGGKYSALDSSSPPFPCKRRRGG